MFLSCFSDNLILYEYLFKYFFKYFFQILFLDFKYLFKKGGVVFTFFGYTITHSKKCKSYPPFFSFLSVTSSYIPILL